MKTYIIKKSGDKWQVWAEDGKQKLGEHPTEEAAKAQLRAIETSKKRKMSLAGSDVEVDFESDLQTIRNVDVFAVGTWRGANSPPEGDTYTEKDLQEMVEAYKAGVVEPKIKITHGPDLEQIEVGAVENLRVDKGRLWGDFVRVPKSLYELMKRGLFKARSSEVLWNVKDKGGKAWGKVLKAVALLAPGQRPAVEVLNEGYTFEKGYCYELAGDGDLPIQAVVLIQESVDRALHDYQEGQENERRRAEEARKKMALEDLIKKYGAKDEADLERILGNAQEAEKRLKDYEVQRKDNMKKDFEAHVEQAIKDGKILPKEKDTVMQQFEGCAYDQSKVDNLKTFISGMAKKVDLGDKSRKDGDGKSYDTTKPPASEVNRLAKEYQAEGKAKDYKQALEVVKTEHPELWKSYNSQKK